MITKRILCTFVASIVLQTLFTTIAIAGNYSLSAHGDPDFGVLRRGMPEPYATQGQGNCAHCHSQHGTIDGVNSSPNNDAPSPFALFANTFSGKSQAPYQQVDLFCFYCHCSSGQSLQDDYNKPTVRDPSVSHMTNRDYSATFGLASGGPDNIMDTFNQASTSPTGSNHNLLGLQNYGKDHLPYFKDNSDPCTVCHNPHIARRNKENLDKSEYATISLPSDHSNHWGDEDGEQMFNYTGNYRAPYVFNKTNEYEPAGFPTDADHAAKLMPDYNTFCLECHGPDSPTIVRINGGTLKKIDWATPGGGDDLNSGDKHGVNIATDDVDTIAPYSDTTNLVLSCCDCHEPHGSPYASLIRRSINGTLVDPIGTGLNGRGNQCRQCHKDDYELTGDVNKKNMWQFTHHGGRANDNPASITDNPYAGKGCFTCHYGKKGSEVPIPCEDCHGHGGYVGDGTPIYTDPSDAYPTRNIPAGQLIGGPRKTF